MRTPFEFQGVEHWTGPELMETVALIMDEDEADVFMSAYVEQCDDHEHCEHNIAYMIQTTGGDDMAETAEMFGVSHLMDKPLAPRQWFRDSSLGVKS